MTFSCAAAADVCGDSAQTAEYSNRSDVDEHEGPHAYVTMCAAIEVNQQGTNHVCTSFRAAQEPEQASLSLVLCHSKTPMVLFTTGHIPSSHTLLYCICACLG